MPSQIQTIPNSPVRVAPGATVQFQVQVIQNLSAVSRTVVWTQLNNADTIGWTSAGWTSVWWENLFIHPASLAEIYVDLPSVLPAGKVFAFGFTSNQNLANTVTLRIEATKGGLYVGNTLIGTEFGVVPNQFLRIRLVNNQFWVERLQTYGGNSPDLSNYTPDSRLPGDPPDPPEPTEYWALLRSAPAPQSCGWFPLRVVGATQQSAYFVRGTYSAQLFDPACLSVVADQQLQLSGSGGNYLIVAPQQNGTFPVQISFPGAPDKLFEIIVGEVVFTSSACGTLQPAGARVTLQHNAGTTATIQVSGGLIVPNSQPPVWILPNVPGVYTARLFLNGEATNAQCQIEVQPRLFVNGIEDDLFEELPPGECYQFEANLPATTFRCINRPETMNRTGMFCADREDNGYFGETWYEIEVVNESQVFKFWIHVLPIYPRCPQPKTMKPDVPVYTILKDVGERGCPDRRIISNSPVFKWSLAYEGLTLEREEAAFSECNNSPDLSSDLLECEDNSAATLDRFFMQMRGETRPFWFRDENGRKWKRVYISEMTRTHEDWESQDRVVKLIWEGCCEEAPIDFPPPVEPQGFSESENPPPPPPVEPTIIYLIDTDGARLIDTDGAKLKDEFI